MAERLICIHGHFYQPPRENPWLEAIERQDTAYPYHDWNERITAECYEPNGAARILNAQGRIVSIVNNYSRISFNIGPTLLSWLEEHAPSVYQSLLEADRAAIARFGAGSAMAQCYNHMIMPLATRRDKETQIVWGIRDFTHRFGRKPEGMWLPETAVDMETLQLMAANGICFTVLAPSQISHVRPIGESVWQDVYGSRIDPTRPYLVQLADGRSISVFIYDGPVSRAVAFERLLSSGTTFANRIAGIFDDTRSWAQIASIATDGESYGHHHRHGEMALAYALQDIETRGLARLINYAAYLNRWPPTHEVRIIEQTAWSCVHGLGRWQRDCGCNTGANPGWNQAWRAPLRAALDRLREQLAPKIDGLARRLLNDPVQARNDYIEVILQRTVERTNAFLQRHAREPLQFEQAGATLKLLELQRHLMLMYTSCGWFFDDVGGIETIQVLMYAGRAVQLAEELFGETFETDFLEMLALAQSNSAARGDGRRIYENHVIPARVDLQKVAAHFAMAMLFNGEEVHRRIYAYEVEREDFLLLRAGKARLALGRLLIRSSVTRDQRRFSFAVLHLGDHNLSGGVRAFVDDPTYQQLADELSEVFQRADMPGVLRLIDLHFGQEKYTLRALLGDEQQRILQRVLTGSLAEAEAAYRQIYDEYAPLMRFLASEGTPVPREFQIAAEFALNTELRRLCNAELLDFDRITALLREAQRGGIVLDAVGIGYALGQALRRLSTALLAAPTDRNRLQRLFSAVGLARSLPFETNLWRAQNVYDALRSSTLPPQQQEAARGFSDAADWIRVFSELGDRLGFQTSA
jgi:alpha-amylase/alpha-mannosidase (GH57 family)